MLNVESVEELHRLAAIAQEEGLDVAVGIRVNPDVTTDTHPYISTGESGIKFGVPVDQVMDAAAFIAGQPRLKLTTIAMHLGSQLSDTEPFRRGHRPPARAGRAHRKLQALTRSRWSTSAAASASATPTSGRWIPRCSPRPSCPCWRPTGHTVYLEPGRFLVGSAGVLLTEVLYRKHSGGKEFVVVDAGMNDLVRPSHYQAYHEIVELEASGRPAVRVDVVGPVCETGDFLALDRTLPDVVAGDRLAVLGAGAYGFVMASNYNTRPRPAEVVVDGARWWVARPRERVDQLFHDERMSP